MDLNKLKEIQAVVFDMDGLMFDSERYVQKSWDIAGERLGYGPLRHNIVNPLRKKLSNLKKYFLKHYVNEFPIDKFLDSYKFTFFSMFKFKIYILAISIFLLFQFISKFSNIFSQI